MRGSINKTSLKKQTSLDNNRPMYGAKTIFLAHEATLGDTGIDLANLSMPTSLYDKGYRNPSQKEIEELNLSFYSAYLKIVSTTKNELMKVSYDVVSGTQINFDGWTADSGEIFEMTFASPPMDGTQYFDARPLVKTYLLPEGETDVIVDDFELNKFPDYQLGAVMVQRAVSGLPATQLRNVGNSPTGDGNYYEVAGVAGVSKVIRFNTAAGVGGDIAIVTSIGSLVQAPQQTFLSYIETINGAQQKVIDALVALGYSRDSFEAMPNSVDLATFGQRVYDIENKEVSVAVQEAATYTNYTSKDASNYVKFATLEVDTSSTLFTIDNTTYTRFTFTKSAQFVANCNLYVGTGYIYWYDISGSPRGYATAVASSNISSGAVTGVADIGDYFLVYVGGSTPTSNQYTNFSIVATEITKTKIKDLI